MIALLPLQVDQKVQDSFKASDQEFQDKFQDSRSRVWRQFQGKWRNIVSIHEASEHCSHDPTASVRVVLSMVVFLGRLKLNMTSVARAHDQPSAVPPSACQFQSSAAAPSADQPSAVVVLRPLPNGFCCNFGFGFFVFFLVVFQTHAYF